MSLTLSEIALPTFLGGLATLKNLLTKAAAHADANKIDERALLDARLFPDMMSFTRQIQMAADTARRGVDRVVGVEPSSVEDNETTFAALVERVEATIAHVKAVDRATLDSSEDRKFTVNLGQAMDFTGRSYIMGFGVPNFLFHTSTAYAIMRHNGVVLGKRDFIAGFVMAGA